MRPTRALVVPFHRYTPFYQDNYRILFEYWKKLFNIWKQEIDALYFIDSNHYLYSSEDIAVADMIRPAKLHYFPTENFSHADNLNFVLPKVEEKHILLMDMDTLVYDPGTVDQYFQQLRSVDVVSICERANKVSVSRFAPYFFMIKRSTLHETQPITFDPEPPIHLDPIAAYTHKLLNRGATYTEAPDDRSSLYLSLSGEITKSVTFSYQVGFYHVRNFNGAVHLCDTWLTNRENSKHHISVMPDTELARICGWLWVLNEKTVKKEKLFETILEVVAHKGFKRNDWDRYIQEFLQFHKYLP